MREPAETWLLLVAKRQDDFSLRARKIYSSLIKEHYPRVKFGFIDVLQDEELKVAFKEESIPWTFCLHGGMAYKYGQLERLDEISAMLKDLPQWERVAV